jgi:hypothetical protein
VTLLSITPLDADGNIVPAITIESASDFDYNSLIVRPDSSLADYNNNGLVEQSDLDLVLLNWGSPLADPAAAGWINDLPSGPIDQGELDKVLLNWGSRPGNVGAANVPEPTGLAIALVLSLLACVCCPFGGA